MLLLPGLGMKGAICAELYLNFIQSETRYMPPHNAQAGIMCFPGQEWLHACRCEVLSSAAAAAAGEQCATRSSLRGGGRGDWLARTACVFQGGEVTSGKFFTSLLNVWIIWGISMDYLTS